MEMAGWDGRMCGESSEVVECCAVAAAVDEAATVKGRGCVAGARLEQWRRGSESSPFTCRGQSEVSGGME